MKKLKRLVGWIQKKVDDKRWSLYLVTLLKDIPPEKNNVRSLYTSVLDNEHTYLYQQSTFTQDDPKNWVCKTFCRKPKTPERKRDKVVLELTKRVLDKLRIADLVGIQPITGPVGLVYKLRYTEVDVEADAEEKVFYPDGKRVLKCEIQSQATSAYCRKLHAKVTLEAKQDLIHNHAVEDEIYNALSSEVAGDITAEVLKDLVGLSQKIDFTSSDGAWLSDKVMNLIININRASHDIGRLTRRGCGNWVVVDVATSTILLSAKDKLGGILKTTNERLEMSTDGLIHIGTLNESMELYTSLHMDANKILVGYKGRSGEIDTGYVYSPYIMLMPSGVVVDPMTFSPLQTLMTRYAKTTDSMSSAYYCSMTIPEGYFFGTM